MKKINLIIILAILFGSISCSQSGTSEETANLKKEIEELKKEKADAESAKQKEDLQKQQEALEKEKQKLATEKKKQLAENKKTPEPKPETKVERGKVSIVGGTGFYADQNFDKHIGNIPENETVDILQRTKNSQDQRDETCKVNYKGKVGFVQCYNLESI